MIETKETADQIKADRDDLRSRLDETEAVLREALEKVGREYVNPWMYVAGALLKVMGHVPHQAKTENTSTDPAFRTDSKTQTHAPTRADRQDPCEENAAETTRAVEHEREDDGNCSQGVCGEDFASIALPRDAE